MFIRKKKIVRTAIIIKKIRMKYVTTGDCVQNKEDGCIKKRKEEHCESFYLRTSE